MPEIAINKDNYSLFSKNKVRFPQKAVGIPDKTKSMPA
jgi:hypothetical protein